MAKPKTRQRSHNEEIARAAKAAYRSFGRQAILYPKSHLEGMVQVVQIIFLAPMADTLLLDTQISSNNTHILLSLSEVAGRTDFKDWEIFVRDFMDNIHRGKIERVQLDLTKGNIILHYKLIDKEADNPQGGGYAG